MSGQVIMAIIYCSGVAICLIFFIITWLRMLRLPAENEPQGAWKKRQDPPGTNSTGPCGGPERGRGVRFDKVIDPATGKVEGIDVTTVSDLSKGQRRFIGKAIEPIPAGTAMGRIEIGEAPTYGEIMTATRGATIQAIPPVNRYRLRNGLVVEPTGMLGEVKIISVPQDFRDDRYALSWEVGETLFLVTGDIANPLTWRGVFRGPGYDVVEKL